MWPVFVVMLRVLSQDLAEVLFPVDKQVVQALTSQRSHIPLRERVVPHRQLHLIRSIGTDVSG